MDLTISLGDSRLYIRVAAFIKTSRGFLFEKSPNGYLFAVGGKIKINETSSEALKREVFEELGMHVSTYSLLTVNENLFDRETEKIHEICFVYRVDDVYEQAVPHGFVEVTPESIYEHDIRPAAIAQLMTRCL